MKYDFVDKEELGNRIFVRGEVNDFFGFSPKVRLWFVLYLVIVYSVAEVYQPDGRGHIVI